MTATKKLTELAMLELFERAHALGMIAGEATKPTPMTVMSADLAGNQIPGTPTYYVPEGPCGFAWIVVKPGTSRFARFLRRTGRAHKHYYGGVAISAFVFGQSYDRKTAYADAFAKVLRDAGINAYAGGRLD